MSLVGEALAPEPSALMRLWVHEALRVYCDRLADDKDRWGCWHMRTTQTVLHDVKQYHPSLAQELCGPVHTRGGDPIFVEGLLWACRA